MSGPTPSFVSMAFDDVARPDFADVVVMWVPPCPRTPTDPRSWARAVFDVSNAPQAVRLLLAARQALVGLIGIERADRSVFDVAEVRDGEALIRQDDSHLDFRAAVAFDAERRLLRVTTAVRVKNWRGRLYFLPVSVLHGPVTRAMAGAAIRRLTTT